jgi:acyl carrier protein
MAQDAGQVILSTIRGLIERRGAQPPEIGDASALAADLDMDSLELAELSAALEDELGRDPYSEGIVPVTVGELRAFYV